MNLPTDLLRTFVTIAEIGGFSRAGSVLGRSQPAISLQIKRLEDMVGAELLQRSGKRLAPTEAGETLLDYARSILRLNDEAVACLVKPKVAGHLRLGIPNEFAVSVLPQILARFAQTHRDVTLEVTCDLSTFLLEKVQHGELDLVVAVHREAAGMGNRAWNEDLVWVCSDPRPDNAVSPLPIVAAPEGCVYRQRMIRTLNDNEIAWRIVYSSTSHGGIRAAVLAGLGYTVLARSTVPDGLHILPASARFPALTPAQVALHYSGDSMTDAIRRLSDYITQSMSGISSSGADSREQKLRQAGSFGISKW